MSPLPLHSPTIVTPIAAGVSSAFNATKRRVWDGDAVEEARDTSTAVAVGVKNAMGSFKQINSFGKGVSSAFYATKSRVWDGDAVEEARDTSTVPLAVGVKNAMGSSKQINKFGKGGIWSHAGGGTLGWRQINKAGKKAIYKSSSYNGLFSYLSNITFVGALSLDAYQIGVAAKKDYEEGTFADTVVKSASVAGSWPGAYPAATAGAFLFSPISVVGSLIGGIGGGVLGAIYGAYGGEQAAKNLLPVDEDGNK